MGSLGHAARTPAVNSESGIVPDDLGESIQDRFGGPAPSDARNGCPAMAASTISDAGAAARIEARETASAFDKTDIPRNRDTCSAVGLPVENIRPWSIE